MWLDPWQPFHPRISLCAQTSLPVLRLLYITWSQSYFTVFIILRFMCFPPPQIIVFLHPPHSCLRLFIAPLLLHRPQSMDSVSPHRSTASPAADLCWKEAAMWGGLKLAGYTWTSDGLSAPSSSHISDLFPLRALPVFSGRPMEDRRREEWLYFSGGALGSRHLLE